jgi:formate hydrogenlyase subunit 6/NADH:ubiquinone oxidoreductase subunit I
MKIGAMLRQVLRSLFRKPATNRYPYEPFEVPEKTRGKLKFHGSACIGCKMCERDCPAGAIKITKTGEKQFPAEIHLEKCIYCAQCVDSCLKKALEFTREIELASPDAAKLKVTYGEKPRENPPEKPHTGSSEEKTQ